VTTTAIVLAGGSGTRLSAGENKVLLDLDGVPMLAWSLSAFQRCDLVDDVVLVSRPEDRARIDGIAGALGLRKLRSVVAGGETRHASERAGLEAIADRIAAGAVTLVAIHDAARPFVRAALLERILRAADELGGAVPVLPLAAGSLLRWEEDGVGTGTGVGEQVDAAPLRGAQTPQAFRAAELLAAYRAAGEAGFHGVDTAESVERFSRLRVAAVDGDPENTKVTFAGDLARAHARARGWDERPLRRADAPGRPGGA
jgi:2-C-methyl-D-erythritol 4-phosphate cytidylyltransferase